ncbi:MAG: septum formation initiator family protein [Sphingobacteriales bacterium]|nr:septum formation initiator family protein [Sphingobacteriales bacterium]
MDKMRPILKILKNKYIIAGALFLIWMMFFDPKDFRLMYGRIEKLNELQQSEAHLNNQIAETQKELNLLKTNAETIEKYAREQYYMKKDNEDLFIVKLP